MLRQLLLLPLVTVSSSVSAALFMSDFTVDNGGFDSSINGATLMEMNGELAFNPDPNQNQGAGIELSPATVLGSGITNTNVEALFFDFTFRAPDLSGTEELIVTFGSGSQSGFTFLFEDDELFVVNGNSNILLLEDLEVNQAVNFQVEFQALANGDSLTFDGTTVNGGQNPGQINTASIVTASTVDQTSDTLLVAGATNLNAGQIDAFTFQGTSTQSNSGKITSFAVSDEPIPAVPEPSTVALLFLSGSAFLLRRKRA